MEEKIRLAVFGQKRLSREGGIEIVVKELCTRMAQNGCDVTCYNRAGHHVSGAEYDKTIEYDGIRQKVVPTIEKKGLAAVGGTYRMEEKSRAQELSVREISLIRELAQIRKEHKRELEYEKFDGYELPPRTQFSMLNMKLRKTQLSYRLKKMNGNGSQGGKNLEYRCCYIGILC